jgi:hypothetical protein
MKLVEQVSQFVAKQTGFPLRDISSETSLAHDIGLAGDDSEKFFAAFAKQFDVDLDSLRHMDFKKHFAHEGEFMWSGLVVAVAILLTLIVGSAFGLSIWLSGPLALPVICLSLYLIVKMMGARRKPPDDITVGDLVRAAETGRWPTAAHAGEAS